MIQCTVRRTCQDVHHAVVKTDNPVYTIAVRCRYAGVSNRGTYGGQIGLTRRQTPSGRLSLLDKIVACTRFDGLTEEYYIPSLGIGSRSV